MEGKSVVNYNDWLRRRAEVKASQKRRDPFENVSSSYQSLQSSEANLRKIPVTSGIESYTGAWTDAEKRHLIRRTSYGCRQEDLLLLSGKSLSESLDLILNDQEPMPSPPVNWYQNVLPDENGLPYGQDWTRNAINHYLNGVVTNYYRNETLKMWLMHQCLNKSISIREKLVQFWYHFIPVNFDDVLESENLYCATNSARICYDYMQMFRLNAMGNYKQIIRNVATQPAMMYYLNNQANAATAPDENFAREVMELFTLGSNLGDTYTQNDVIEVAKLLSGWRVLNLNTANPVATFVPSLHDFSTKKFSAFFNHREIAGTGASELDAFVDMLFDKQSIVARNLCRRLYRFFIYYDIDEAVESNFIEPLAEVLIQNHWNVAPVLRVMFSSQHFFDMANRGVMIKSPFDFVLGNMREMRLQYNVAVPTNLLAQYQLLFIIQEEVLRPIIQVMGEIPNVSGWSAYYQKPNYYQFWINSNTLQYRYRYLESMVKGFVTILNGLIIQLKYDEIQLVLQYPNDIIQNPNTLVQRVIQSYFPVEFPLEQQQSIKQSTLLNQQTNDAYWTTAWNNYKANPNNSNTTIVRNRLKELFVHLLQLAEFHLT